MPGTVGERCEVMVAALNIGVPPFVDAVEGEKVAINHSASVKCLVVDHDHFVIGVILCEGRVKVVFYAEVPVSTVPRYHHAHRQLLFNKAYAQRFVEPRPLPFVSHFPLFI